MVSTITVSLDDRLVLAALDQAERTATRPLVIMRAVAGYLVTATQRHFELEAGPDGPWPALSPRTAAKRRGRKQRGTAHILRDKGFLYQSIMDEATDTEAVAGSNVRYAAVHQGGKTIDMPARSQEINLGRTNRGPRFVKRNRVRKETRIVDVAAHKIVIPARPYLYLTEAEGKEVGRIAIETLQGEIA